MENNKDYNVNIYYSEEEVLAAFTNYYDDVKQQTKVYVFTKDRAPLSHYAKEHNVELHHSGGLFAKIRTLLTGKTPYHDQLIQLEITSENIQKYKKIIANGGTIVISHAVSIHSNIAEGNDLPETLEDVSNNANPTPDVSGTEKLTNREKFASPIITDPVDTTSNASTIEPIEPQKDGSEQIPELISDATAQDENQLDLTSVPQENTISPTAQQPQDPPLLNNDNNDFGTIPANTDKQSFPYDTTEALEHEDIILSHPASISDHSTDASDNIDESQLLHANHEQSDASKEAAQVSTLNDLQSIDLQDEPQPENDISNFSNEASSNGYEIEPNAEDYENGVTKNSLESEHVEQISNVQEDISLPLDDRHPEITSIATLEEMDTGAYSSELLSTNATLEAEESIELLSTTENLSEQDETISLVEETTPSLNINNEVIQMSNSLQTIEESSNQFSGEHNATDEPTHLTIKGEDEEMSNKESFPRIPEEAKEHPGEISSHLDAQEDLPEAPHPLQNLNEEEAAFRLSEETGAEYPIDTTDINAPQSLDEQRKEPVASESVSSDGPVLSGDTLLDSSEPLLELDSEAQKNGDFDVSASDQFESEKRQVEADASNMDEETFHKLVDQESNLVNRLAVDDTLHRPDGLENQQTYEAIVEGEDSNLLIDETIGKASEYRRHDLP